METHLYFVLGGPACGKSTLCQKIINEKSVANIIHISVGELLKNEIKKGTEIGKIIYEYIRNANIVPDNITFDVLIKEISQWFGKTILVDGYPRNKENNEYFKTHKPTNINVQNILFLDCDDNALIERVKHRNTNNEINRFDDDSEIIKKRINTFRTQTMQVIDEYKHQGMTIYIDCTKNPNEIFDSIKYLFNQQNY